MKLGLSRSLLIALVLMWASPGAAQFANCNSGSTAQAIVGGQSETVNDPYGSGGCPDSSSAFAVELDQVDPVTSSYASGWGQGANTETSASGFGKALAERDDTFPVKGSGSGQGIFFGEFAVYSDDPSVNLINVHVHYSSSESAMNGGSTTCYVALGGQFEFCGGSGELVELTITGGLNYFNFEASANAVAEPGDGQELIRAASASLRITAITVSDAGEGLGNVTIDAPGFSSSGVPLAPPASVDTDLDFIPDDGDFSGLAGDSPCATGQDQGCDDNCPLVQNMDQADTDGDGTGDACEVVTSVPASGFHLRAALAGLVAVAGMISLSRRRLLK